MDAETTKALAAFGFLTVLECPEHGLFGGYLVLSPHGRPLEFRCSTPVVASRAQEILYGPTLRPYLFADVVGQSLVAGAELPVEVILTDQRDMLPLALVRPEEVLLVEAGADPGRHSNCGTCATINGCRVIAAPTSTIDADRIARLLEPMAAHVILIEPFERIRAALLEAQASTQDALELGDDRAAA
ncbi:MAG TPA: hypothetical protein VF175_19030 [Lacipirellula sp.]